MARVYVAGAPRTRRDKLEAVLRTLRRRQHSGHAAFARFVAARSDRQLEKAAGAMFLMGLPVVLKLKFRPEYAVDHDGQDIDALILLVVTRDEGRRRDEFAIELANRKCRISRYDGRRKPDGTLTAGVATMIRMATASAETSVLISDGKVTASGDPFLLYRFPAMFRQPTRAVI